MEILIVRDKQGRERPMTKAVYDLIGFRRKPKIVGTKKDERPLSEMDKLKADLIAKKEAGFPLVTGPTSDEPKEEVIITETLKRKGGRPPKQLPNEI